jgi:transcriptional regulator with XRE-family HTH domain
LPDDNDRLVEDARREETVGERIRRLRLERKLTQKALAGTDMAPAALSNIESGKRKPSMPTMRLLSRKFGVPVAYIEHGIPFTDSEERELRLSDAELELRLGRDLAKAEAAFRDEIGAAVIEPPLLARAQAGLGLLAVRRADTGEAIRLLEAASESGHVPPETRPDLYETLARCYVADDRPHAAVWLLEECLDEVRERAADDGAIRARFSTYLAAALTAIGAKTRARAALEAATEAARAAPTPQARTRLYWIGGIQAWTEGQTETGLLYMRRAIGLLEAGEDTLQLARAHVVAAQMLNLDSNHEEAADHLERAGDLYRLGGDVTDLGVLRAEQAKVAASRGDVAEARAYAGEAAALLADEAEFRTNIWHAQAVTHAAAGEVAEAEEAFKRALDALVRRSQWREAAQVAREWARLLRDEGRTDEAFRLMEEGTLLAARSLGQELVRARDAE